MTYERLKSGSRPTVVTLHLNTDVKLPELRRLVGQTLSATTGEHDRMMPPNPYIEDIGTVTAIDVRSFGDDLARERKRRQ